MSEVGSGNALTIELQLLNRRSDRPKGRSPANNQDFPTLLPKNLNRRYISGGAIDLFLTQLHHQMMIFRIVIDVASNMLFLNSTNAVFESRSAWNGIRP